MEAFEALCAELEPGRRLSPKVLPDVDAATVYETIHRECRPGGGGILRSALAVWTGGSLADAVANILPGETLKGTLDGPGVVSVMLALVLFEHSPRAVATQRACARLPPDERNVVFGATDTNPVDTNPETSDPDPVQLALVAFLSGDENATAALASAAYGRAHAYGTKAELARTCDDFIAECGGLLAVAEEEETNVAPATQAQASTAMAPDRLSVDHTLSPPTIQFYKAAKNPFAPHADAAPPLAAPSTPLVAPPLQAVSAAASEPVPAPEPVPSVSAAAPEPVPPVSAAAPEPASAPVVASFVVPSVVAVAVEVSLPPPPPPPPPPPSASSPDVPPWAGGEKKTLDASRAYTGVGGGGGSSTDEDEQILRALEML